MMPFAATWMQLGIIILSELSQKDKYNYDIPYMWNVKHGTKRNRLRDLCLPRGKGRSIDCKFTVRRCKLLHSE